MDIGYLLSKFLVAVLSICYYLIQTNQVGIEIESGFKLKIENHLRPFHSRFYVFRATASYYAPRTTDTQWRHKSKKSEILGQCGRQNMLRLYLKIWDWDLIFGRAVKAISWPGVRSPCYAQKVYMTWILLWFRNYKNINSNRRNLKSTLLDRIRKLRKY